MAAASISVLMEQPVYPIDLQGAPYYSIDVECVATGYLSYDRTPAQIALVDHCANTVVDVVIRPDVPVVSYLTKLTGITKDAVEHGVPLEEGVRMLLAHLPSNAVLVGQGIHHDVKWLGLQEGVHFAYMVDLAGAFRVYNEQYKNFTVFNLEHVVNSFLGAQRCWDRMHNACTDAKNSILCFNKLLAIQHDPQQVLAMRQGLLTMKREPSFNTAHPMYEDVCMGNRRHCKCPKR